MLCRLSAQPLVVQIICTTSLVVQIICTTNCEISAQPFGTYDNSTTYAVRNVRFLSKLLSIKQVTLKVWSPLVCLQMSDPPELIVTFSKLCTDLSRGERQPQWEVFNIMSVCAVASVPSTLHAPQNQRHSGACPMVRIIQTYCHPSPIVFPLLQSVKISRFEKMQDLLYRYAESAL